MLTPAPVAIVFYGSGRFHISGLSGRLDQYSVENLNFAVSPADSTVMYYTDYPAANLAATLRLPYVSEDGGQTFNPIGAYGGEPTHGDVRGMYVQKAAADGE